MVDIIPFGMVTVVFWHSLKKVSGSQETILISIKGIKDLFPNENITLIDKVSDILTRVEFVQVDSGGHAREVVWN